MESLREAMTVTNVKALTTAERENFTPLTYACATNNLGEVINLLIFGANPQDVDLDRRNPLICAVFTNSIEIVETLLKKGISDLKCPTNQAAFCGACFLGNLSMVEMLLQAGAKAKSGYLEALEYTILKKHAITYAAQYGHLDIVKLLLKHGANPNPGKYELPEAYNDSPIFWAIKNDDLEMVKVLIKAGVDPKARCGHFENFWISSPIHYAAEYGRGNIIDYLIEIGVDYDSTRDVISRTPLSVACNHGMIDVVNKLIGLGAEINGKCSFGRTPLHFACRSQDSEAHVIKNIILTLVNNGANVNCQSKWKCTPLHWAQSKIAVETLIELGSDVNITDDMGRKANIHRFD